MRLEPTFLEKKSGEALIAVLEKSSFVESPVFGDRPDLTMELNGFPVGIEIVSLLPGKIHEAAKLHFQTLYKKGVHWGKLVVPIEPDEWIKAAIEKKWQIVQAYPKRNKKLHMSLLVHRPAIDIDFEFTDPGFINALSYGSARSKHGFKSVIYWSGESITFLAKPQPEVPPRTDDLTKGYPAWIFWSHISEQGKTRGMLEGNPLPLTVPAEHTKIIPPTTPAFRGLRPHEPAGDIRIEVGFNEIIE